MANLNINSLAKQYEYLVPDRLHGLAVILLNTKITSGEIGEEFSQIDIKHVVAEVMPLTELSNVPHVERITKELLHYLIERSLEGVPNKFCLTDYAKRFIKLIDNKLNNPHKQFPLKDTFDKYLRFDAQSIKSIDDFIQWHTLGFDSASKETIAQHLEAFQDEVNNAIDNLRVILNTKEHEAVALVKKFVDVFVTLGEKASQLAETLDFKNESLLEVRNCVDQFYLPIKNHPHPTSEIERQFFINLDSDWKKALVIYNDVKLFFNKIDHRLDIIKSQIIFASSKLTELQENFKIQSLFKIKLRKFLNITLQCGEFGRDELMLNKTFPRVSIPFEPLKFIGVPYYDFGQIASQVIQVRSLDEEYHKNEIQKIEQEFARQEKTEEWFKNLKQILSQKRELNYEEYFFRILKDEGDIEIPLQVGFELFQYASKSPKHEIEITQIINEDEEIRDVCIWKMKIRVQKEDSIS